MSQRAAAPAAAVAAARRAAEGSEGYRRVLAAAGVDGAGADFEDLPYIDKEAVFGGGDALSWLVGGGPGDIHELMSSSGHSGLYSLGVTSAAEVGATREAFDLVLRELGVRSGRSALLINCLAMGVSVPTSLATIATPTVHLEMALEFLLRYGPAYARVIVAGEPIFLKELFERAREVAGPSWAPGDLVVLVGGEWVAEGWRRHLSRLAGIAYEGAAATAGVLISMGAAEIGLHALYETPQLRAARRVLQDPSRRVGLFAAEHSYAPSLLTYDSERFHFEERTHDDGTRTLVCTTLGERLLPLVRYDLGDAGEIVPVERIASALAGSGETRPSSRAIVALWGRRRPENSGVLRPEAVKEALFALPDVASALTGRFSIDPGARAVHFQLRQGAGRSTARQRLRALLDGVPEGPWDAIVHERDAYPFHAAADYQHKPTYEIREPISMPKEPSG